MLYKTDHSPSQQLCSFWSTIIKVIVDPVLASIHCVPPFLLWFSGDWRLHCFPKACGIISITLMATDGQCCAQCILVKTGSLTWNTVNKMPCKSLSCSPIYYFLLHNCNSCNWHSPVFVQAMDSTKDQLIICYCSILTSQCLKCQKEKETMANLRPMLTQIPCPKQDSPFGLEQVICWNHWYDL